MAREKAPYILSVLIHAAVIAVVVVLISGQPPRKPASVTIHFVVTPPRQKVPAVSEPNPGRPSRTPAPAMRPAAPVQESPSSVPAAAGTPNPESPQPSPEVSGPPGLPEEGPAPLSAPAFGAKVAAAVEAKKTYPDLARRRGTEGTVRLRLQVASDGRLISENVAVPSGSALLDHAALDLAASVFPLEGTPAGGAEVLLTVDYSLKN